MKLNPDCIRDLLLTVESNTGYKTVMFFYKPDYGENNFPLLEKYSYEEVRYHIQQCDKSYLIDGLMYVYEFVSIGDLTPEGHSFLANIHSDNNWNKTKNIAKKVGSFSLDALKDISASVISSLISSQFDI